MLTRAGSPRAEREWFALFDDRTIRTGIAPSCGNWYAELARLAQQVRTAVLDADEAARRAGVYPGNRRDARQKFKLNVGIKD